MRPHLPVLGEATEIPEGAEVDSQLRAINEAAGYGGDD
jgi:hypothetical protein